MRCLISGLVICVAITSVEPTYGGETLYFQRSLGTNPINWSNADLWWKDREGTEQADGLPEEDDRVVIMRFDFNFQNSCEIDIDNAVADSIVVEFGVPVTITAGSKLTLDHDNGPTGDHNLTGHIILEGDSELAFEDTDQTIVDGGGDIVGEAVLTIRDDLVPKITIEDSTVLTSEVTIGGELTIEGLAGAFTDNGKFINDGIVHAGNYPYMTLVSGTIIDDTVDGRWLANGDDSRLVFNTPATGLEGSFLVNWSDLSTNCELQINQNVTTTGELESDSEEDDIIVASGKCFTWDSGSKGSGCSEPEPEPQAIALENIHPMFVSFLWGCISTN